MEEVQGRAPCAHDTGLHCVKALRRACARRDSAGACAGKHGRSLRTRGRGAEQSGRKVGHNAGIRVATSRVHGRNDQDVWPSGGGRGPERQTPFGFVGAWGTDRSDSREKSARGQAALSLPVGAGSRPLATTRRAWFPPRTLPGSVRLCSLALRGSCCSYPPVAGTNYVRHHATAGIRNHARFHRNPHPPRPPFPEGAHHPLVNFPWMGLYLQAGGPWGRTERANVGGS